MSAPEDGSFPASDSMRSISSLGSAGSSSVHPGSDASMVSIGARDLASEIKKILESSKSEEELDARLLQLTQKIRAEHARLVHERDEARASEQELKRKNQKAAAALA